MTHPTPTKTQHNKNLVRLLPPQGMSRAGDILPFLPFGRTTLHEWSRDGRFPAGIKLSPTMVAWRNSDVLEWIENHSNPADNTQENTND
ncbi:helix-turn-helix transcriptional regulator [Psychrobacter faecalis]|uniref:helix-turn-helix transcriptional regulator n=1 Tax=Psychrobacter faecalis TaxID=180588 RepID=UPI003FD4BD00